MSQTPGANQGFINAQVSGVLSVDTVSTYTTGGSISLPPINSKSAVKNYNNSGHADLTSTDSGSTVLITQDGAYTINVPDPAVANKGVKYTFIVETTGANAVTINTVTANGNKFIISIANGDATTQTAKNTTGQNTVKFAATATVGDTIRLMSNGSLWIGDAVCQLHDKITCP